MKHSQRRKWDQKYNSSVLGVARQLRSNHGYDRDSSVIIARKCLCDYQRCEICGLPQYWNRTQKFYYFDKERVNRRLVPDHIIAGGPSDLSNTRILCHSCNSLRGPAWKPDDIVLDYIKEWYEKHYPLRVLWWLNKTPGCGGTLFRNIYMERKAIKLLGQDGVIQLATLNIHLGTQNSSPAPFLESICC